MLPLIPLVLGGSALGGVALLLHKSKGSTAAAKAEQDAKLNLSELTPAHRTAFDKAMNVSQSVVGINAVAKAFEKHGGAAYLQAASMLRKRAALRGLPEKTKQQNRHIFKMGMKSTRPDAVAKLAGVFERKGATGAAEALRKHATSLTATK